LGGDGKIITTLKRSLLAVENVFLLTWAVRGVWRLDSGKLEQSNFSFACAGHQQFVAAEK